MLGKRLIYPGVKSCLSKSQIFYKGELDFSTFLSIMHRQLQQEAPEDEILEALRMADKEHKGYILVSELRAKLTGLGEKLTDKEGEETFPRFISKERNIKRE
uniref:Calmodulin-like 4b n=1 Tax=Neogobius melanostomus TaxID=47308 RepID=A0A8C6S715_9GOBI